MKRRQRATEMVALRRKKKEERRKRKEERGKRKGRDEWMDG